MGAADSRRANSIDDWTKIAPEALVDLDRRLRREGFVAAVREDLKGESDDRGALSIVVQLRNARAATDDLARQTPTDPSGGGGISVIFADGAFTYHVGAGSAGGAKNPPTTAAVLRAAAHLYARVRGR